MNDVFLPPPSTGSSVLLAVSSFYHWGAVCDFWCLLSSSHGMNRVHLKWNWSDPLTRASFTGIMAAHFNPNIISFRIRWMPCPRMSPRPLRNHWRISHFRRAYAFGIMPTDIHIFPYKAGNIVFSTMLTLNAIPPTGRANKSTASPLTLLKRFRQLIFEQKRCSNTCRHDIREWRILLHLNVRLYMCILYCPYVDKAEKKQKAECRWNWRENCVPKKSLHSSHFIQ